MTEYLCDVCKAYTYDDAKGDAKLKIAAGTSPSDFPSDWACPICKSDKSHMKKK